MMDDGRWVMDDGRWVTGGGVVHDKSPFVDVLLLWQQVVCQSKKDFGTGAARCIYDFTNHF